MYCPKNTILYNIARSIGWDLDFCSFEILIVFYKIYGSADEFKTGMCSAR